MGNFKDKGRNRGSDRRRDGAARHRLAISGGLESLETRRLLSGGALPTWKPTSADLLDAHNGPMANLGPDLVSIYGQYQTYLATGKTGTFSISPQNTWAKNVKFLGDYVGVSVYGAGDFSAYIAQVQSVGMVVGGYDVGTRLIDGLIPIGKLPQLAALKQTDGARVQAPAISFSQGLAKNQSEQAQLADVAKTQFNVNGAGVTVGVLSDSVNRFAGGLADSVRTGDLPKKADGTAAVNVLFDSDLASGQTDEGRAMLEHIYDIAPGAGLAYSNAFSSAGGETVMAAGIQNLASQAGAKLIVDDIGFAFEPYYQDGPVGRAISTVAAAGVTYFSAAGNSADHGYESPFRGVNGNIAGIGAGRFMNFDPSGASQTLLLPVTVVNPGRAVMQFAQAFNNVTSEVDAYILDANGAIIASGTANNVATQQPIQDLIIPSAGNYFLAFKVAAGSADPDRAAIYSFTADLQFSHQFGTAGGTNYPTTFGHPTADAAIGVGAVAWYDTPAFPGSAKTPTPSETFSSFGPSVKEFASDGSRLPSVEIQQTPVLSGSDGGNTSFFGSGPGAAPPNLPAEDYTLKNFYGTSDAAPDVTAVAALMLQLSPGSNPAAIRAALIQSTIPLNGTPKGTWDRQGGYGFIQAPAALAAVDTLRVIQSFPAQGAIVSTTPTQIVFQFSRPIDYRTISASDLRFAAASTPGDSFTVGQPLMDLNNPYFVFYPVTFTHAPGSTTNGAYSYILGGSIRSLDGKPLTGFAGSFAINDVTPPQVSNVNALGRYVTVTFSKPVDPATITRNTVYLVRAGGNGTFPSPTNQVINQDPRIVVGYDAASQTAILDFSRVDQNELPADHYALVVLDAVTDLAGNKLDGEFKGIFPSGDGKPGGVFIEDLGQRALTPPQILSLSLAPASDTGIVGDQNTDLARPSFVGQVLSRFPEAAGGLTVVAEFNALHSGTLDLNQGLNGRGFSGGFDVVTTTDAAGRFTFQAPVNLPSGFQSVRVVVVGAADQPPLPGLSARQDYAFREDLNGPILVTDPNSLQQNARVSGLTNIVIDAVDPVLPSDLGNPLAVPVQFVVPALDPSTANNISNYSLINYSTNSGPGGTPTTNGTDYSSFITSATFVAGPPRQQTTDPFTGTINLTFAPGLPAGHYVLYAHRAVPGLIPGIADAAGNPINSTDASGATPTDFALQFDLQPTPAYITGVVAATPDPLGTSPDPVPEQTGTFDYSGPKSYFEIASPGVAARATAAPTEFVIDVSNPLNTSPFTGPNNSAINPNLVQLIRSANSATAPADGDFGNDPTFQSGVGYTRVAGTTVRLVNSRLGATFGTPGYKNRLILSIPAGTTLPADHYRLYVPNQITPSGEDLRLFDQFNNQLDGEFLGNPSPSGDGTYQNLLPTGQMRPNDLTGDGVPGGAFETGYIVVPNGNVIFARPDYQVGPNQNPDTYPDGSPEKPYAALAPEATPDALNGGDLNSTSNYTDPNSAELRPQRQRPVRPVGVRGRRGAVGPGAGGDRRPAGAERPVADLRPPGPLGHRPGGQRRVGHGAVQHRPGVPGRLDPQDEERLPVRAEPGVQPPDRRRAEPQPAGDRDLVRRRLRRRRHQQRRLQQRPQGGDYGGIVFRNFDDTSNGGRKVPVAPGPQDPLDGPGSACRGPMRLAVVDQPVADPLRRRGRPADHRVPLRRHHQLQHPADDHQRDHLPDRRRELRPGRHLRRHGQLPRGRPRPRHPRPPGQAPEQQHQRHLRPRRAFRRDRADRRRVPPRQRDLRPAQPGRIAELHLLRPPALRLRRPDGSGRPAQQDSNGATTPVLNRVYFQPGTVAKFQRGAAIDVLTPGSSINIGDRTYVRQFDANNNLSPSDATFHAPTVGDAQVIFTSFFDNAATTSYRDPNTGSLTTIVAPIDSPNSGGANQPTPGVGANPGSVPPAARWGGLSVQSGAVAMIDEATFEYGGGSVNTATGTIGQRDVLAFEGAGNNGFSGLFLGTRAYITNNNFLSNLQAPISDDPNGLLASDPLRPLLSGNPFFRGNIMLGNDLNGLEVKPETVYNGTNSLTGINGYSLVYRGYNPNTFTDTVWDDTDLTYVLRSTIILAGFEQTNYPIALPPQPAAGSAFLPELKPSVTLTIQSSLPDSRLANGQSIPRPGESAIVKLLNTSTIIGDAVNGMTPAIGADDQGGAGFISGWDNGIDPPADTLVDTGYLSQIRFLGIGGNQTTGQQRVPVILTSVRDNTVGRTVRGVPMFQAEPGVTTAAAPGDGGVILFGANGLSDYNLLDPRDGSLIDNTDIKYMTRIEQQGGGWVYTGGGGQYSGPPRHRPGHPVQHRQGDDGVQLQPVLLQPGRLDRAPLGRDPIHRQPHRGRRPARPSSTASPRSRSS